MSGGRALALLLAAALVAGAAFARDGAPGPVERPEDDLLVLDLRLDGHVLVEGFVGYLAAAGVLLPLAEVAAGLDFPIEVDAGRGVAEGWFLAESRPFSLDAGRGEVFVEGRPARYDGDRIERHRDGLYVESRLLGEWLPVDFEVDLARLEVVARPREKLPLERRLERRRAWRRFERATAETAARPPAEPLAYRWLDWPAVDQQLRLAWRRDGTATAHYDALVAGDLLGMNAELAFGTAGVPRLRLERKDPEGRLGGPLRATELAVGDVWLPGHLAAGERRGRGFVVSSFPLDRPREFDRVTLAGEALPGWEVELYRNQDLVAFQAPADGRYEFTDVPLLYGFNLFRLVFHGPHGERREKVERYVVGPGLIRDGESHYRVAALRDDDLGWRSSAEYERGLRLGGAGRPPTGRPPTGRPPTGSPLTDLSFTGQVSSSPDGHHAGVGLAGMGRGLFARLELASDLDGGWAGRALVQTRIRGWHLFAEEHRFSSFVSEATGDADDPLVARGTMRLETRFARDGAPSLGLRMAGRWSRHVSGRRGAELAAGLSRRFGRYAVSKAVSVATGSEPAREDWGGSFLVSTRARRLGLRASAGYRLAPPALTDAAVTVDWRIDRDRSLRLGLRHDFTSSPATRLDASLSWRFTRFALSLGATLDAGGRARAQLTLSSSFGRHPFRGRYRASGRPLAAAGAVAARAFLDHDLDGRYGDGDEPLPGIAFRAGGRGGRASTGVDGTALIAGLPVHDPVDVGLAFGGLEDPSWVTSRAAAAFVLRPGRTATLEVPVVVSGEVDGTVYLRRDGAVAPASKVRMQLLDREGEVRRATETVFDGFYLFAPVPPGRYLLRVDPEQTTRLGLVAPAAREILVEPGRIVGGLDFVLRPARVE